MSDATALPEDEPISTSNDASVESDLINDPMTLPSDEQTTESQGDEPLMAELGEDGQGDLAPADEPETFTDDEEPRDLRTEL